MRKSSWSPSREKKIPIEMSCSNCRRHVTSILSYHHSIVVLGWTYFTGFVLFATKRPRISLLLDARLLNDFFFKIGKTKITDTPISYMVLERFAPIFRHLAQSPLANLLWRVDGFGDFLLCRHGYESQLGNVFSEAYRPTIR